MNKKKIALIMTAAMAASMMFAGCGKTVDSSVSGSASTAATGETATSESSKTVTVDYSIGLKKNGYYKDVKAKKVVTLPDDYTHIEISREDLNLDDIDVASTISQIAASYGDRVTVDRAAQNKIKSYDEKTGKGLIRHALIRYGFKTKEIMVCLVINGKKLPKAERLIEKLIQIEGMTSITISPNTRRDNVIMGDSYEILWGQGYITDYIGNVKYQISPLSFYQVNPVQTEKLYGLALEYADLKGDETVWDLYCGIGTISLFLAQKAKQVYGVEIVPQAIDDAKENAKINAIDNAEFFVGKAEEVLPEYYAEYEREHNGETAHADVIVVDPPRKGCDETLLETIVKMQPEKVVYVSCDSATLARDLKYLCANGYEIRMCRGVDQFPQSVHVETVVLLSQQKTR